VTRGERGRDREERREEEDTAGNTRWQHIRECTPSMYEEEHENMSHTNESIAGVRPNREEPEEEDAAS